MRAGGIDSGLAGDLNGGGDQALLFIAEQPVLPRVGVEAADGDPRRWDAEAAAGVAPEVDHLEDSADGQVVQNSQQRHVDGRQNDVQLRGVKEHGAARGAASFGEEFGVARVAPVAGQGPGLLADGAGDDGIDAARVGGGTESIGDGVFDEAEAQVAALDRGSAGEVLSRAGIVEKGGIVLAFIADRPPEGTDVRARGGLREGRFRPVDAEARSRAERRLAKGLGDDLGANAPGVAERNGDDGLRSVDRGGHRGIVRGEAAQQCRVRLGDTIVAPASGAGQAPRAMIRLSGAGTPEVLRAVLAAPPSGRGCRPSRLRIGGAELPVLVACFRAPDSYTGEEGAEIVLAGSPRLVERVLGRLVEVPGVRHAEPGEFTARAYLLGRLSLGEAEAVGELIAARSEAQIEAARRMMSGESGARYQRLADEAATLLALVEAGIDFTDQEDVTAIAPEALRSRALALRDEIISMAGRAEARAALPRVVLVGRPNAGKSTLFNALLGRRRAVVSASPGSTRDVLEEELDLSGDAPGAGRIVLIDIAGLEEGAASAARAEIAAAAQEAALGAVASADVAVYCDPSGRFAGFDGRAKPVLRVRTKADLPGEHSNLEVCALDGWNMGALRRGIADAAFGSAEAENLALAARHRLALREAGARLEEAARAGAGRERLETPELVAEALRSALDRLGELCGRITPDDVIGRVFSRFCVGK